MDVFYNLCEGKPLDDGAIALDNKGTLKRDDAFSYRMAENGNLIRTLHIYDMPALVKAVDPNFLDKTKGGNINLFYRRRYPGEYTEGFALNQSKPAISFETEIDLSTKEVVDFKVYASAVKLKVSANMRQVKETLSKEGSNFKKTLSLDPCLEKVLDKCSDKVGYGIINEIKKETERHLKQWLEKNSEGVSFVFLNQKTGYFTKNKSFEDFNLLFSTPIRSMLDLQNLANIGSILNSEKIPSSREKMRGLANAHNPDYLASKKKLKIFMAKYPRPGKQEIEGFLNLVFEEKDYEKAEGILAKKPEMGLFAIELENRKPLEEKRAPWDSYTKRAVRMDSSGKKHFQSTVSYEGKLFQNKVRDVASRSRLEINVFTGVNFWRDFLKDPDFKTKTWNDNEDLFDMKDKARSQLGR